MSTPYDHLQGAKDALAEIAKQGDKMGVRDVEIIAQSSTAMALIDIAESLRTIAEQGPGTAS